VRGCDALPQSIVLPSVRSGTEGEAAASTGDVLSQVLARAEALGRGGVAREVVASVLAGVLAGVEAPVVMRDALVDTEPGSVAEALGVVGVIDQLRSALAALDAVWQVTAAARITDADAQRGVPTPEQGRAAAQELGLARRVSPASSSMSLAASRRLVTQLPGTISLLAQGRLTEHQARAIAVALDDVDPDTARAIDETLTADPARLDGAGTRRLGVEVRALRDVRDPEDCRRRAGRAARGRCVRARLVDDHMVAVTATLRALDASAVMKALRVEAEARRVRGSIDAVRALEADALVDAICGGDMAHEHAQPSGSLPDAEFGSLPLPAGTAALGSDGRIVRLDHAVTGPAADLMSTADSQTSAPSLPGAETTDSPAWAVHTGDRRSSSRYRHRRITVGVVITDRALLSPDGGGELARLEGYGPIPAQVITDTLAGKPPGYPQNTGWDEHPDGTTGAVMRRLYTHPRTGELVGMESRARAFPAPLEQMIRWRESTCASPWCNARVRHIDHITPYARGGPTSYANAQGLCARCNLLKDHAGWTVTPARDDHGAPTVTWASPGGATATCHLPPLGPRETTGAPATIGSKVDEAGPSVRQSGPEGEPAPDFDPQGFETASDPSRPDHQASPPVASTGIDPQRPCDPCPPFDQSGPGRSSPPEPAGNADDDPSEP